MYYVIKAIGFDTIEEAVAKGSPVAFLYDFLAASEKKVWNECTCPLRASKKRVNGLTFAVPSISLHFDCDHE